MKEISPEVKSVCKGLAVSMVGAARTDDDDVLKATFATVCSVLYGLTLEHEYDYASLLREAKMPEEYIAHTLELRKQFTKEHGHAERR